MKLAQLNKASGIGRSLLMLSALVGAVAGCGNHETSSTERYPQAQTVKARPFSIVKTLGSPYDNNADISIVARISDGGSVTEWTATAIAIAEKVGSFGAKSVDVTVLRPDVAAVKGTGYDRITGATATYRPSTASRGEAGKNWVISQADASQLVTQHQINLRDEGDTRFKDFIDSGVESTVAEKRMLALIIKKYHLPVDFSFAHQFTENVRRNSMNVDSSPAIKSLDELEYCVSEHLGRCDQ
jgi:hypothetical protein